MTSRPSTAPRAHAAKASTASTASAASTADGIRRKGGKPAEGPRPNLTEIGGRIRSLRGERGMSLRALAEASDVGAASLSQLENGQRNPTLATLYALAGALQVPLALLLDARAGASAQGPGVWVRLLDAETIAAKTIEVYRLHLDAGASRRSPAHGPGVTEHVQVVAGRLRAGREGDEHEADAAESLQWVSDRAHTYQAVDGPVDAVLVITTPVL